MFKHKYVQSNCRGQYRRLTTKNFRVRKKKRRSCLFWHPSQPQECSTIRLLLLALLSPTVLPFSVSLIVYSSRSVSYFSFTLFLLPRFNFDAEGPARTSLIYLIPSLRYELLFSAQLNHQMNFIFPIMAWVWCGWRDHCLPFVWLLQIQSTHILCIAAPRQSEILLVPPLRQHECVCAISSITVAVGHSTVFPKPNDIRSSARWYLPVDGRARTRTLYVQTRKKRTEYAMPCEWSKIYRNRPAASRDVIILNGNCTVVPCFEWEAEQDSSHSTARKLSKAGLRITTTVLLQLYLS